jgi:hypothetical protein
MKVVAGGLVLLSGAVLFAGGAIAEAILTGANRSGYSPGGNLGMVGGALLGIAGLAWMAMSWRSDSAPPQM